MSTQSLNLKPYIKALMSSLNKTANSKENLTSLQQLQLLDYNINLWTVHFSPCTQHYIFCHVIYFVMFSDSVSVPWVTLYLFNLGWQMPSYFLITRMNRCVIKKQICSQIKGIMSIISRFHYRNPISLWPVGENNLPAENNAVGLKAVWCFCCNLSASTHNAFGMSSSFWT